MAALGKTMQISKTVNNVTKLLGTLSLSTSVSSDVNPVLLRRCRILTHRSALLHTTAKRDDLMEFFDDEKNWTKSKVPHGRAWEKEELRLKSNEDLHKLWYVLLKERNMLLTMEHAYKTEGHFFPSGERFDKVEISMENLEHVVRERNKAYYMLETGETGERPAKLVYNQLGLRYFYRMGEHVIPKFLNSKWRKTHIFRYGGYATTKFLRLYREKLWTEKRKARNRERNTVLTILRRFPNVDIEAIKEKYPSVDVEKLKQFDKARGHWVSE